MHVGPVDDAGLHQGRGVHLQRVDVHVKVAPHFIVVLAAVVVVALTLLAQAGLWLAAAHWADVRN